MMLLEPFSNLFRKKAQLTPLGQILKSFTRENVLREYGNSDREKLRVAMATSRLVLAAANDFCSALVSPKSIYGSKLSSGTRLATYDVAVWEIAAYCHYWLMKELLLDEKLDEDERLCNREEEEGEQEKYTESARCSELIASTLLSGEFISEFTQFKKPAKFFGNRAMSFCRSSDSRIDIPILASRLERILYCSIQAGKPVPASERKSEDADLETTLTLSVELLHLTMLPALFHLVDQLFERSQIG